ncbi:Release factor glutamine methyltransferase [bioreactor metagenome]|uniref:peptide chain release factor N(5)-glutamine methyltransferase n=1 Tax=bioreactor metagenome TaxID=1076179 RepID=A0A645F3Y3_9ZZZZ
MFPPDKEGPLAVLTARRLQGEPLQYILGEWDFMGLPFFVGPEALIPRQDTETLCEAVLQRRPAGKALRLLDLCCGTGCIGLSLGKLGGYAPTLADISPACLDLARRNAARLEIAAAFAQGDLFAAFPLGEKFDIICCNPPYIPRSDLDALQPEVRREPRLALDGGTDGLDFYRRIAREYPAYLARGGLMALEIGFDQRHAVSSLLRGGACIQDICGQDRVILLEG